MSNFPIKPVRPVVEELTPQTEKLAQIERYDPLVGTVEVDIDEPTGLQISNQHATDYLENYITPQELPQAPHPTLTTYPQYTPNYAPLAPIQAPSPVIPTTSAVAIIKTKSNLIRLWTAFGLLVTTGILFALHVIPTMNSPRNMNAVGFWLLISPLALVGILLLTVSVKEKGYQPPNERILAYVTLGLACLVPLAPIFSVGLYASGIGN